MLESIAVMIHVIIIVVWIGKEIVGFAKYIHTAHIQPRKEYILRCFYFKHLSLIVVQGFSYLISEVGIGGFVANNFHRIGYFYAAMVGGDN